MWYHRCGSSPRCQWIYDPYFWGLEIYWVFGTSQHRGQNSGDNCHEKNLTVLPIKNYLLLFSSQVSIKKVSTSLRKIRFSTRAVNSFMQINHLFFTLDCILIVSHDVTVTPAWRVRDEEDAGAMEAPSDKLYSLNQTVSFPRRTETLRKSWKWTNRLFISSNWLFLKH